MGEEEMKNFSMLVVDDEDGFLRLFPEAMGLLFPGCHVDVAGTPLEAFKFLERPFEIVMSDFDLGDVSCSGVGVLCVAKRKYPKTLTILTSANFNEAVAGTSISIADAGAEIDCFLEKPFKIEDLGEKIQNFLDEKERRSGQG
jgi:DNA-binding NtrC family response regulator